MTARPHCPSCGHFKSHAPRTDSLTSGKCTECSCLSGWQEPWDRCPWCNLSGAPYEVQKECKYFSKADVNLICAACGHNHYTLDDATCSGSIAGSPYVDPCSCNAFVRPSTPCEEWSAKQGAA